MVLNCFINLVQSFRGLVHSPGYVNDIDTELEKGFYRTDLLFGSGNSKHPLIIVDRETQVKLKREKMKGIYLEPVYD